MMFWVWGVQSQWKKLYRSKCRRVFSQQIYVSYILCSTQKSGVFYMCKSSSNERTLIMCIANCQLLPAFFVCKLTRQITLRELPEFHYDIIPNEGDIFNLFDPKSRKDNRSLSTATFSIQEKMTYCIYAFPKGKICLW